MDNEIQIEGYKTYIQMSESEKRMVDEKAAQMIGDGAMLSNDMFDGLVRRGIVNPVHLQKLNEAMDKKEMDKNEGANKMREQLFIDRVRNGFYGTHQSTDAESLKNNSEVSSLKNEVSSLKEEIRELKELLKNNIK